MGWYITTLANPIKLESIQGFWISITQISDKKNIYASTMLFSKSVNDLLIKIHKLTFRHEQLLINKNYIFMNWYSWWNNTDSVSLFE